MSSYCRKSLLQAVARGHKWIPKIPLKIGMGVGSLFSEGLEPVAIALVSSDLSTQDHMHTRSGIMINAVDCALLWQVSVEIITLHCYGDSIHCMRMVTITESDWGS